MILFFLIGFQHISEKKISSLLREFTQILDSNGRIYIYEQIQQKKAVSVEVHVMRKEEDYIELFRQEGFEFVKSTKLFRMPSYGMSLFNKIGMNHPIILKFCSMIEFHTIDRKPEFVDYFTICLEFRKSTTS